MTARHPHVPPMDLANMRAHGVSAIEASCYCGRRAIVDVSALAGSLEVPSLRRRLRCSSCGERPYDVRPNWRECVKPVTLKFKSQPF